jgi:hypothetical protein
VDIREVLEHLGIIQAGASIRHLDMAPAFQRREHHEQIGRAVALILVVGNLEAGFIALRVSNQNVLRGEATVVQVLAVCEGHRLAKLAHQCQSLRER